MYLVIDETRGLSGTVGRILSRHKSEQAARTTARAIRCHLRRALGKVAAVGIKIYRTETLLPTAALAPVDLVERLGE